MNNMDLNALLKTMDVPEERRDLKINTNIRWLLRNIQVRNSTHKDINAVLNALKERLNS